uniref:Zgc:154093 n=1 Tax=Lates calcarifer TaxID=8187 RepID=A0A4W6D4W3_LATCA
MPAKTPIYLKTTTPKKGKKLRLRDVLSGDMISPPLGDVRHSAHVGPEGEGDMFGDVGFLQGKMDMLPSLSRTQNGHARSYSVERHMDEGLAAKHDPHNYAYNGYHYQHSSTGLLKTTISMPVFIAHEQAPPKPPRLHLDDPSPPSLPSQSERSESPCAAFQPASLTASPSVSRSDSMAGLNLDLGPSILEDVLSIMDQLRSMQT